MSTSPIIITPSTSVVLVNTGDYAGNPVVLLPNLAGPGALGRIITIRDNDGGSVDPAKSIYLSTTGGARFQSELSTVTLSTIRISQPYGFITITPRLTDTSGNTNYGLMNVYAFPEASPAAYINTFNANFAYLSTLSTINLAVSQDTVINGNLIVGGGITYVTPGNTTLDIGSVNTNVISAATILNSNFYGVNAAVSTINTSTFVVRDTGSILLPNADSWSAAGPYSGEVDPNSLTLGNPGAGGGAQIGLSSNFFGIRAFTSFDTPSIVYSTNVVMRDRNVAINPKDISIGIDGNTFPDYRLFVNGSTRLSNEGCNNNIILLKQNATGTCNIEVNQFGASGSNFRIDTSGSITEGFFGNNFSQQYKWLSVTKGGSVQFWTASNTTTDTTARVTIDNVGRVGIATTTPAFTLDVSGSSRIGSISTIQISTNSVNGALANIDAMSTNLIRTGDGSVGIPSFSFGSDTNTGLYRPGADTIGVTTGGAERARIDSAGNVGIRTTNPGYTLDVNGSFSASTINYAKFYTSTVYVGNDNSNANTIRFRGTRDDDAGTENYSQTVIGERIFEAPEKSELLLFKGNDTLVSGGEDRIRFFSAYHQFDLTYNNYITWPQNADPPTPQYPRALTIRPIDTTSGGFGKGSGIGVNGINPSYPVDVSGELRTSGTARLGSYVAQTLIGYDGSAYMVLGRGRSDGGGPSYIDFNVTDTSTQGARIIRNTTVNGTFDITNIGTGSLRFGTNNIPDRMVMDSAGRVGINTASPNYTLDVSGTIMARQSIYVGGDAGKNGAQIFMSGGGSLDSNYNFTVIESRSYNGQDQTELLLFKGNDANVSSGPDRIRLRAGQICFDTYEGFGIDSRTTENIRMVINSNGYVGINNTTPIAPMMISKNSTANINSWGQDNNPSQLLLTDANTNSYNRLAIGYNTVNDIAAIQSIHSLLGAKNLLINPNGGNIGIGITETPGYTLDVGGKINIQNSGTNRLIFSDNNNDNKISLYGGDTTSGAYMGFGVAAGILRYNVPNTDSHVFYKNGTTELMRIDSAGNVGIGCNAPSVKLDVSGNTKITGNLTVSQTNAGGLWVAVGSGTNHSIATSYDGINWTGQGDTIFTIGYKVAYNGILWVAVGSGPNTVAYSYDGFNWTGLGLSVFNSAGSGIAWNGSLWVAVGNDSTDSIATSPDGIHWTKRTGKTIFSFYGNNVAWNGSLWIAVGWGTNTIAYSYNGTNWTGIGAPILVNIARDIAWNGSLWVAVGNGNPRPDGSRVTIATSENGVTWYENTTTAFSTGYSIAWNGSLWVAGGQAGANTLAYSYDGLTWIPLGKTLFNGTVHGISWNGSLWVAVGETNNTIAYSSDGINWTSVGTSPFNSFGLGVAYSNKITPQIVSNSLSIYTQKVPYYLDGSNNIFSYPDNLTINSKLRINGDLIYKSLLAYACRAWVNFSATGGVVVLLGQGNVSSVSRNDVGDFTLTFSQNMPDANYSIVGCAPSDSIGNGTSVIALAADNSTSGVAKLKTTSQVRILCSSSDTVIMLDGINISIAIFR